MKTGFTAVLMFASAVSAASMDCTTTEAAPLGLLLNRWRWEGYWQQGVVWQKYRAGPASLELIWTGQYLGVCAKSFGVCVVYERLGQRLGDEVLGGSALSSFTADEVIQVLERRTDPSVLTQVPLKEPHTCSLRVNLPQLSTPDAIRLRRPAKDWPELQQFLKQLLRNVASVQREQARLIVPYYSQDDPFLFVLDQTGSQKSVLMLVHSPIDGAWKIGGHFDEKFGQHQSVRLEPKIKAAAFQTVTLRSP